MSNTPRTDAAEFYADTKLNTTELCVTAEFAEQLERDLSAAVRERDEARAEVARLREALERISNARPDQLDHAIDVGIIERCAKVAARALDTARRAG